MLFSEVKNKFLSVNTNILKNLSGNILIKIALAIHVVLIIRSLGGESFRDYAMTMATITLGTAVSDLGLNQSAMKSLVRCAGNPLLAIIGIYQQRLKLAGITSIAIVCFILIQYPELSWGTFVVILLGVVVISFFSLATTICLALGQHSRLFYARLVFSVTILISTLLARSINAVVNVYIGFYIASYLASLLVILASHYPRNFNRGPNESNSRLINAESMLFYFTALSSAMVQQSSIFFIGGRYSAEAAGGFLEILKLIFSFFVVPVTIGSAFVPSLWKMNKDWQSYVSEMRKYSMSMIFYCLMTIIGVLALSGTLLGMLNNYSPEAPKYLLLLSPIILMEGVKYLFGDFLTCRDRQAERMFANVLVVLGMFAVWSIPVSEILLPITFIAYLPYIFLFPAVGFVMGIAKIIRIRSSIRV